MSEDFSENPLNITKAIKLITNNWESIYYFYYDTSKLKTKK